MSSFTVFFLLLICLPVMMQLHFNLVLWTIKYLIFPLCHYINGLKRLKKWMSKKKSNYLFLKSFEKWKIIHVLSDSLLTQSWHLTNNIFIFSGEDCGFSSFKIKVWLWRTCVLCSWLFSGGSIKIYWFHLEKVTITSQENMLCN